MRTIYKDMTRHSVPCRVDYTYTATCKYSIFCNRVDFVLITDCINIRVDKCLCPQTTKSQLSLLLCLLYPIMSLLPPSVLLLSDEAKWAQLLCDPSEGSLPPPGSSQTLSAPSCARTSNQPGGKPRKERERHLDTEADTRVQVPGFWLQEEVDSPKHATWLLYRRKQQCAAKTNVWNRCFAWDSLQSCLMYHSLGKRFMIIFFQNRARGDRDPSVW